MLAKVRAFFAKKGVLEVDTPILSKTAPIDAHIDVMTLHFVDGTQGYLHTSPEYAMKRLLSEHPIDMYQLGHVYREAEISALHNPEFTMIEWYRMNFSLHQMIDETIDLIQLFLETQKPSIFSYRQFFLQQTGLDPFKASSAELYEKACLLHPFLPEDANHWTVETWLHFYMSFILEPSMKHLTVIHSFPASQAALARVRQDDDVIIADRFEIFYQGIELANGFYELTDAQEQRSRLEKANQERESMYKQRLPIDENFLKALEKGLPNCCGVAAGFDRLFMLKEKAASLQPIFPLTWQDL
jgi:lysyl-tRNA synthetase class 2